MAADEEQQREAAEVAAGPGASPGRRADSGACPVPPHVGHGFGRDEHGGTPLRLDPGPLFPTRNPAT